MFLLMRFFLDGCFIFFSNSTFVIIFKQQSPETKHDILYKIFHFSLAGFPMWVGVFGAANVFFFRAIILVALNR